ncbi:MAG: hypothetical protein HUJ90_05120 [Bacteroidales bacterium]|nr:hypothetical protein [Bacteroidales bacterium]
MMAFFHKVFAFLLLFVYVTAYAGVGVHECSVEHCSSLCFNASDSDSCQEMHEHHHHHDGDEHHHHTHQHHHHHDHHHCHGNCNGVHISQDGCCSTTLYVVTSSQCVDSDNYAKSAQTFSAIAIPTIESEKWQAVAFSHQLNTAPGSLYKLRTVQTDVRLRL